MEIIKNNQDQRDNSGEEIVAQQKEVEKSMWELLQRCESVLPENQLPYTSSVSMGVDIPGISVYSVEDAVWVLYRRLEVLKNANVLIKHARAKAEEIIDTIQIMPKEFFNEVDPLPARFARIFFCARSVLNTTLHRSTIRNSSITLGVIIELVAMTNQLTDDELERYNALSAKGERVAYLHLNGMYHTVKKAGEKLQDVLDGKLKRIEAIHETMLNSDRAEPDALELLTRVYAENKKWNDPTILGQDKRKLASSYGFVAHLTVVELKHAATMLMFPNNETVDKLIVKTKNTINHLYFVESGGDDFSVETGVEEYQNMLPVLQKLRVDFCMVRGELTDFEFNKIIALLTRAIEYVTIILTVIEKGLKND